MYFLTSYSLPRSCLHQAPDGQCTEWGVNYNAFPARISNHPERVENLFFTYLFALRAVVKAEFQLRRFDLENAIK
jgi:ERO1-like protein alpha